MKDADFLAQVFRQEAEDLLVELESSLLELEATPDDRDLIDRTFRAMHTIKGSGAIFGFEDVSLFTHEVETIFDLARSGQITVTKELIKLTLVARDRIQEMFEGSPDGRDLNPEASRLIIAKLQVLKPDGLQESQAKTSTVEPGVEAPGPVVGGVFWVRFKPPRDILFRGTQPLALLADLAELGQAMVFANTVDIPPLHELTDESCFLRWDVILEATVSEEQVRDVFMFVEDESELTVRKVGALVDKDDEARFDRLGDILLKRGDISEEDLCNALKGQKRLGEILTATGKVSDSQVAAALAEQTVVSKHRPRDDASEQSMRISTRLVDNLMNLSGEFIVARNTLAHLERTLTRNECPIEVFSKELRKATMTLSRIADELQDNVMTMRMVPVRTVFMKFTRIIRDISQKTGKQVELVMVGEETELDKGVAEGIGDPLVHLVRNAADHGIEPAEDRLKAGKPAQGKITLSASHQGNAIVITVSDDGAGLDPDAILNKAIQRGLVSPERADNMEREEIFKFILQPGFSTAKTITDISGRGVGMDVVMTNIKKLGGVLTIQSEKGQGTTIRLELPLTLAIVEALLVRVGGNDFALPVEAVRETVKIPRHRLKKMLDGQAASLRGKIVAVAHLGDLLGIERSRASEKDAEEDVALLILDNGDEGVGIAVDALLRHEEIVIKPLEDYLAGLPGLTGASIMGDGRALLILDPAQIISLAIK